MENDRKLVQNVSYQLSDKHVTRWCQHSSYSPFRAVSFPWYPITVPTDPAADRWEIHAHRGVGLPEFAVASRL